MTGNCQRCGKPFVVSISAWARDCFDVRYPNGREHNGYFPEDLPFGGSDEMEVEICLNCGQVQGEFPVLSDWSIDV